MSFDILTASSANGIITPARGARSTDLIPVLAVPPEVLEHKRALRRRYDAVLVGPTTVRVNDPTLASHALPGDRPVRVTLDPAGTIPAAARFFDGSVRTIVGVGRQTPARYLELLRQRGVEFAVCGGRRIDLVAFTAALAERGLARVLVEGGGRINRELLESGLIARIHLILLPTLLDSAAVNLFEGATRGPGRLRLEDCRRLADYLLMEYSVMRQAA